MLVEEVQLLVRVSSRRLRDRMAAGRRLERLVDVGWNRAGHVGVNAEQFRRRLHAHQLRDDRTPIAALRHELRVSEALHQHDPGACDADGVPAGRGRLA